MKKNFILFTSIVLLANYTIAQDTDDDKKFRLGLKVAAQPTWFSSNDANTTSSKTGFGFGFGLVTEFRLAKTAALVTGIGGDFESGSIRYKYDPTSFAPYDVRYVLNKSNELQELKDGMLSPELNQSGFTMYNGVTERKIKTTFVTIPVLLKMMTKEISGFKYFGLFGAEIGVRVKARATDKYTNSSTATGFNTSGGTNTNININSDAALIPIRFGMNVGLGAEYRLSGSTSAFITVNYFRAFTSLMRRDSKYMAYDATYYPSTDQFTFFRVKQGLFLNAVRINFGILF